jgi:hypothetical protein
MPIKWLNPMEQTCTFFVNHLHNDILRTIINFDNIPICLCTIHHGSFEAWFNIPMFEHCVVELCPNDLLWFGVFKLHVANYNGHDFAISHIINMVGHRCPTNDLLHMVKHDSRVSKSPLSCICAINPTSLPTPLIDI